MPDTAANGLDTLQAILTSAHDLVSRLAGDARIERLIRAFSSLPPSDRATVLGVLERDATWRRIVEHTADTTGISVRANPHASLYVHVVSQPPEIEAESSRRDVDVIRFGIQRLALLVPMLFQPGVYEQWTMSARELVRVTDADLLGQVARLARETLALIAEAEASHPPAAPEEDDGPA